MSNNHLPVAREILKQLLSTSALKGARLKPMLIREFEARTGTPFSRAFWQFPKFLLFLNANKDIVEVTLPTGPGDILVQLRDLAQPHPDTPSNAPSQLLSSVPIVQPPRRQTQTYLDPAFWHAFTNPDPARKRFYNPTTKEVLHYLEGSTNPSDQMFESKVKAERNLIEIVPIPATTQNQWMKSFLENHEISETKRQLLESLVSFPYSSLTNKTFSAALETHADVWRRYRTSKIIEHVDRWTRQNLPHEQHIPGLGPEPAASSWSGSERRSVSGGPPTTDGDLRAMLHTVVDALNDSELSQVLIPASVLRKALANTRK